MKYLKWVPLVLFVLLLVLTGAVVAHARNFSIPVSEKFPTAGLDVCAGKRCLFQIVPGHTTWDEAKESLAEHITRDQGDHFHGQIRGLEIRVQGDFSGSQISRIDVQGLGGGQSPLALRFGQIIEQFGLPCYVIDVRPRNGGLVVAYPSFRIWVLAVQDRITPDSPIGGITLVDDIDLGVENKECRDIPGATPWRGFASLQLYEGLGWIER